MATHAPIVFIVHEEAETRRQIHDLVEGAGLQARSYADAIRFLDEVPTDQPGCLVLGAELCSLSAAEVEHALVSRGARLPIVIAAGDGDPSSAASALKGGAVEVIGRPLPPHRMVAAILCAIAADLSSRSCRLEQDDIRLRYAQLTPREREVLKLVVEGQTSGAIARQLGIREKTIEIYRSHINKKMRARNAVQLARMMPSLA
jgi:two-component system response regulator FixJ